MANEDENIEDKSNVYKGKKLESTVYVKLRESKKSTTMIIEVKVLKVVIMFIL